MIVRFLPDSWRDALLRPLAMAASDAGVYVEIMAPDLRFAAVLLLGAIALFMLRRRMPSVTPVGVLALWLLVAFAVWLLTSGNGRYFMPGLLFVGPLCIALATRLPGTKQFRVAMCAGLVALQGWVVFDTDPWGTWGLGQWNKAPFFPVELDEQARTEPATYVTVTIISYSLIAPQFHPASSWLNISALPDASHQTPDSRRAAALLRKSAAIKLVVPSRPDHMIDGMPTPALQVVLNDMLAGQRLRLAEPLKCRLLPSRGLASVGTKIEELSPELLAKMGFWVCDLQYPVAAPVPKHEEVSGPEINSVFNLVEQQCPRFYQPGQASAARVEGGWMRMYPQADIRLYVMDDGAVYYKYWRAMNPALLGQAGEIRAGAKVACESVRGRSGLPWEREI
jgi:hypothetical protein